MFEEVTLLTNQSQGVGARLASRVRWVAVRGLAAAVAGVVVLGVGGRLLMFGSRLLHPEAVGRITENGNRIGEFTVNGTIELILFGGLLSGVTAGVIWVIVRRWIPQRQVAVGLAAVAIGGFNLIEADNRDFVILGDPRPDLVLLLGLVFVFGASLLWVERWLDRRLPEASGVTSIVTYSVLVAVGAPLVIPVIGSFFDPDFCSCDNPPIWSGVFLLMTAAVTALWWMLHLRGSESPTKTLRTIGLSSVVMTAIAGAIHLVGEIIHIL